MSRTKNLSIGIGIDWGETTQMTINIVSENIFEFVFPSKKSEKNQQYVYDPTDDLKIVEEYFRRVVFIREEEVQKEKEVTKWMNIISKDFYPICGEKDLMSTGMFGKYVHRDDVETYLQSCHTIEKIIVETDEKGFTFHDEQKTNKEFPRIFKFPNNKNIQGSLDILPVAERYLKSVKLEWSNRKNVDYIFGKPPTFLSRQLNRFGYKSGGKTKRRTNKRNSKRRRTSKRIR